MELVPLDVHNQDGNTGKDEDYSRTTGKYKKGLRKGHLSDWMKDFDSKLLTAAPVERVIKIENITEDKAFRQSTRGRLRRESGSLVIYVFGCIELWESSNMRHSS